MPKKNKSCLSEFFSITSRICISMDDKTKLNSKGLTWEEFEKRIDKIFLDIQNLIKDTNDTSDNR